MPRSRVRQWWENTRSYWLGPYTSQSTGWSLMAPVSSGVSVTEESALNYSAVWAAVSLISDDIASLPLKLYRRLPTGGKDVYETHPLYRILHDAPNPEQSSMVVRRTMQAHALTWGNGYAEIQRDGANRPVAIWPITPDRVTPIRDQGVLRYSVTNPSGRQILLDAMNVLHLPGLGFDGLVGYSVIAKARESIGLGVAAERFGGTFFGNGSTFGGVISYPTDPPEQTKENTRKALESRHQGVERAHRFLTLYGGAKYERLGIPPDDAQFLETRVFQIREIARWFKIPPHKLADLADATFSNVEQQNLDYYTSCLRPWLELWEQELTRKLVSGLERNQQFVSHVVEGLLRADATGRSALYASQFQVGGITPNEIRNLENLDPIEGGSRSFVPLNMIPLDRVDEWVDAQIAERRPRPESTPNPTVEELKVFIDSLEDRCAAREAQLTTVLTERSALEAQLAESKAVEGAAREALQQVRVQLADVQQMEVAYQADMTTLRADVARAQRELVTTLERATAAEASAREILQRSQDDLRQAHEAEADRRSDAARLQALLDQAQADVVRVTLSMDEAQQRFQADLARHVDESRVILAQAQQESDAVIRALRADVDENTAALQMATAETMRVTAAHDALREAKQALDQQLDHERSRRVAIAMAQRSLVAEAWDRIIAREVDRARKAQATPEKLRRHVELFYPSHDVTCRTVLRAPVRAWLVAIGKEDQLESILDGLIARHIDDSMRSLRLLADEHDGDSLAPALERVVSGWETSRADASTERLIREAGYAGA